MGLMAHSVSTPAASERLQTLRRGWTGSFNLQLRGVVVPRDLADPDGHMWAALWMDPATMPAVGN